MTTPAAGRIRWDKGKRLLVTLVWQDYVVLDGKQCDHKDASGHYVVKHPTRGWCKFEWNEKVHSMAWVAADRTSDEPARRAALRWYCNECAHIMPLGEQLP